jgi:phosphosulfolactate synthase
MPHDQPKRPVAVPAGRIHSADFIASIGVPDLPPRTAPFDPGYDPRTFEGHLEQSAHLMEIMKISMATWQIADEAVVRRKVAACLAAGVPAVTGGGPFEIAVQQGRLEGYIDMVADFGFTRMEAGEGFTDLPLAPRDVVALAAAQGLEVQFELGKKHGGTFTGGVADGLIRQGETWLEAGARQVVVEARESAAGVGVFREDGSFDSALADRFATAFGLEICVFEAPNKPSQFALLNHFGAEVHLCNIRLEEVLRVEIYRRGLHSDAFGVDKLRPRRPLA